MGFAAFQASLLLGQSKSLICGVGGPSAILRSSQHDLIGWEKPGGFHRSADLPWGQEETASLILPSKGGFQPLQVAVKSVPFQGKPLCFEEASHAHFSQKEKEQHKRK